MKENKYKNNFLTEEKLIKILDEKNNERNKKNNAEATRFALIGLGFLICLLIGYGLAFIEFVLMPSIIGG